MTDSAHNIAKLIKLVQRLDTAEAGKLADSGFSHGPRALKRPVRLRHRERKSRLQGPDRLVFAHCAGYRILIAWICDSQNRRRFMIRKPIVAILFSLVFSVSTRAEEPGRDYAYDQEALNQSLRQEALSGVIPRIERLIRQGANINGKAPHGESALEYAIRFGRYGAALRLIQLGANPNAEDDSGLSPLLRSASDCNGSRVVEALLRAGANVNHHDLYGRTALINAAHADCVRTIAVILLKQRRKSTLMLRTTRLKPPRTSQGMDWFRSCWIWRANIRKMGPKITYVSSKAALNTARFRQQG